MQELVSYMYFRGGKNGGLCRKPFQSGILTSIKSIIGLYYELKNEEVNYIMTTRVNQDVLNFFLLVSWEGVTLILHQWIKLVKSENCVMYQIYYNRHNFK